MARQILKNNVRTLFDTLNNIKLSIGIVKTDTRCNRGISKIFVKNINRYYINTINK